MHSRSRTERERRVPPPRGAYVPPRPAGHGDARDGATAHDL